MFAAGDVTRNTSSQVRSRAACTGAGGGGEGGGTVRRRLSQTGLTPQTANLSNVLQDQFDSGHYVPVPKDKRFKGPVRCQLDAVTAHLSPLDRTNAILGILEERFFKSRKKERGGSG